MTSVVLRKMSADTVFMSLTPIYDMKHMFTCYPPTPLKLKFIPKNVRNKNYVKLCLYISRNIIKMDKSSYT